MATTDFHHLLAPTRVGTMELRNRVMVPPHGARIGNLWGTDEDAARNIAYWEARARAGAAWVGGVTGFLGNVLIPGFEPTGGGVRCPLEGHFRQPFFVDRIGSFADRMHAAGAVVTIQMVMQGGAPHGPSPAMAAAITNVVPHVLDGDDLAAFTEEYRVAARQAALTGVDGIEFRLNHDDLLEWFVSPRTNHRTDAYGGSVEGRLRFPLEILTVIREEVGSRLTVGVRMNLSQGVYGGYDERDSTTNAQLLEASGLVDYFNVVVGTNWGNPSYIQPHFFAPAQWAAAVGELKRAVSLPVIYAGRVTSPEVAESVLAAGHADVVAMARAHIADPEVVRKVTEGRAADIRPCIGCNECISRPLVEELPFACAVNPDVAREVEGPLGRAPRARSVLVVGGGPAGMELAALAAGRGHRVALWEATDQLGGQLRLATAAPGYDDFVRYLAWQARRLGQVGVDVVLGRTATVERVRAEGVDVVAVATGARARVPDLPGVGQEHVHEVRDVLAGRSMPGHRVVVVAQEDHMAPLAVADLLADHGHDVTVLYASNAPAPLLSRYIVGGMLGRLDAKGVAVRCLSEVVAVTGDGVQVRHVYSGRTEDVGGFDSVVLACGGVSDSHLYAELRGGPADVHVLGDAYAPRRLVYATRQARALAEVI